MFIFIGEEGLSLLVCPDIWSGGKSKLHQCGWFVGKERGMTSPYLTEGVAFLTLRGLANTDSSQRKLIWSEVTIKPADSGNTLRSSGLDKQTTSRAPDDSVVRPVAGSNARRKQ